MTAIVTIENQTHIYDIYSCIVCEDNKVLLRVSYCFWDIVVYDVPTPVIDFFVSQIKEFGFVDFTQYKCKFLQPDTQFHSNESVIDDYEQELHNLQQSVLEH